MHRNSLRTVLGVALLFACSCARYRTQQSFTKNNGLVSMTKVAYIDRHMAEHVSGVLGSAGIHANVGSTMDYSVSVPATQKARALELLRKDAEEHHYSLQPDSLQP